jgi:hypothetical protein
MTRGAIAQPPVPRAVYSLPVVLQRRGGSGLAVVIAVAFGAAGAVGCGGPIDSRLPDPRDAGTNSGTGGKRTIDPVHDAGTVEAAVDVAWPTIPGCVSGLPPAPLLNVTAMQPIAIGCASSSAVLLRVSDTAAHGMSFTAGLSPPIDGLSLDFAGNLCASDIDTPVELVVRQFALQPGPPLATFVWVTPVGPSPQLGSGFALQIRRAPIDFTIDPAVVDFGTVPAGVYQRMPITITNAVDGAMFDGVFPSQQQQGPFLILPIPSTGAPSLQPGESRQMLAAILNTQATGTFEASFLVSAFPPGTPVDPACGIVRPLTVRAQIVAQGPPP